MFTGDINDAAVVSSYLNNELSNGRTQKDIEINDFGVSARTIEKRLKRKGYKKVDNQFILAESNTTNKGNNKKNKEIDDKSMIKELDDKIIDKPEGKVLEDNVVIEVTENDDYSMTKVLKSNEMQLRMINILENYDKIMNLIGQYDKQYDKQYEKITIELPIETTKEFRTTIRVNNVIWEQFNTFCNKNKIYTKRDLISMALKEYMDNHK